MKNGKMSTKTKNIIKIIIVVVLVICLVILGYFIYEKLQANRFKKMLQESDSNNYKLTEIVNDVETEVYVRDRILFSKVGNTRTWVSEFDSKRVIFDEEYKTVITDVNDDNLKVNSLNYTFINDFFDNSNQSFNYLGEEDGCYKVQFTEKGSKKITLLYINKDSKDVEKMIQDAGNFELITEFRVEKNTVSKDEVELPNLEGYRVYESSSSN